MFADCYPGSSPVIFMYVLPKQILNLFFFLKIIDT